MAAINKKEKRFVIIFKEINMYDSDITLHNFIEEQNTYEQPRSKYLYWSKYLPNSYIIATFENPYWNINNLTKEIRKYFDRSKTNHINFIIIDITESNIQGYIDKDFWKWWHKTDNLTENNNLNIRKKKIKKIIELQKISDEQKKLLLEIKELKDEKNRIKRYQKELSDKLNSIDKQIKDKQPKTVVKEPEKDIVKIKSVVEPKEEKPDKKKKKRFRLFK